MHNKKFWAEMGVRVEVDRNDIVKLSKDVNEKQDYKKINSVDDKIEIRTFCFCDDGIIRKSFYDNAHITFNGEHLEKTTNKANVGIVLRTNDINSVCAKEIIQRFKLNTIEELKLNEYRFSSKYIIGNNVDKYLKQMLNQIFDNNAKGKVVGPEIEKFGYYFEIGKELSIADGLYFVGDCTVLFRGLMPAFISGCYVANIIVDKLKFDPKFFEKSLSELNIKSSNTDKMKLIFTAQSKMHFYCRDVICEYVFKQGHLPINPFRVFDYFLSDRVDRDIIRRANNQLVNACEELWVFGNIANGVLFEISRAMSLDKNIRFFTIGTDIKDIKEISIDNIKFEPEVHAKQIKKENIINFIKNRGNRNNIVNQINLF